MKDLSYPRESCHLTLAVVGVRQVMLSEGAYVDAATVHRSQLTAWTEGCAAITAKGLVPKAMYL